MNDLDSQSRPLAWPWLIACAGGLCGAVAAFFEELTSGWALGVVVVGPVIEEILKPIGTIYLIDRRPRWIRSAGHLVAMCVVGAAVFAALENLIYIYVYHPGAGRFFICFRLTVCTSLHIVCSAIVGFGLVKTWRKVLENPEERRFDIDDCLGFFVAAVVVHGGYNLTMMILEATKVLQFPGVVEGR